MQRIVVVQVKALACNKAFEFDEKELQLLASCQFNIDSNSFTPKIIKQTMRELTQDILKLQESKS